MNSDMTVLQGRPTQATLAWFGTLYFLLIGFGVMLVEIGLIQRISIFLDHQRVMFRSV